MDAAKSDRCLFAEKIMGRLSPIMNIVGEVQRERDGRYYWFGGENPQRFEVRVFSLDYIQILTPTPTGGDKVVFGTAEEVVRYVRLRFIEGRVAEASAMPERPRQGRAPREKQATKPAEPGRFPEFSPDFFSADRPPASDEGDGPDDLLP